MVFSSKQVPTQIGAMTNGITNTKESPRPPYWFETAYASLPNLGRLKEFLHRNKKHTTSHITRKY